MNAPRSRKPAKTSSDFHSVVNRPGPAPTGRAVHDHVSPRDVSYQPTSCELKFIERLTELGIEPVARAEAECIIRKNLTGSRVMALSDRQTILAEAAKFGITLDL